MTSGTLRLRAVLANHFYTVVAIAAVFVIVGGWLVGGAYLFPGSHTVDRTESSWAADGNFTHQATVVGNGSAFEPGSVVSNRVVYFESVMPVLETTHTFVYEASGNGSLDAVVQSRVVVEGVSGTGDDAVTYWSVSEPVATNQISDIEPGEPVQTAVTVNVSAAMERARTIAQELGTPSALLQARIVFDVHTGGTVNNHSVNQTLSYLLPMTFRGGIYQMQSPIIPTGDFRTTNQIEVTNDPGFVGGVLGPLFVLAGLMGGGGVILARRNGRLALTDREQTWLTYQIDRAEYDDWISRVGLPDDAFEREVIETATLADLVDVAIDANEPVLEDQETGNYHVLHDGYRYTFDRPPVPGSVRQEPAPRATRRRHGIGDQQVEALREHPYQRLRQIAAREGLDVGASPSKADLVNALARADINLDGEEHNGEMAADGEGPDDPRT